MTSMFQAEETHLVSTFTTLGRRDRAQTPRKLGRAVLENSTYNPRENLDVGNVGPGPREDDVGLTSDNAPGLVNTASICSGSIRWFTVQ